MCSHSPASLDEDEHRCKRCCSQVSYILPWRFPQLTGIKPVCARKACVESSLSTLINLCCCYVVTVAWSIDVVRNQSSVVVWSSVIVAGVSDVAWSIIMSKRVVVKHCKCRRHDGIAALEYLLIATVVVMKTVGPVLMILGKVCCFGERVEYTTLLAAVIMIVASCAYALFDAGFSMVGYAFICVNVLCST
eukprot:377745-Rhodomonas_salina.1